MAGTDLEVVLDWAAGEGWTPGRHDAPAFEAVDPDASWSGWWPASRLRRSRVRATPSASGS